MIAERLSSRLKKPIVKQSRGEKKVICDDVEIHNCLPLSDWRTTRPILSTLKKTLWHLGTRMHFVVAIPHRPFPHQKHKEATAWARPSMPRHSRFAAESGMYSTRRRPRRSVSACCLRNMKHLIFVNTFENPCTSSLLPTQCHRCDHSYPTNANILPCIGMAGLAWFGPEWNILEHPFSTLTNFSVKNGLVSQLGKSK